MKTNGFPSRHTIWHYLILTRLYTWVDSATVALAGFFSTNNTHNWSYALSHIVPLGISMWVYLNWVSEYKQRDQGRTAPPLWLISLPLLFSFSLVLVNRNPLSLFLLLMLVAFIWIYPYKKEISWIANICFVVRGLHTATMFLLAASVGGPLHNTTFMVAIGLGIMQAARSLVAEVRDAPYDRLGLPSHLTHMCEKSYASGQCLILAAFLSILSSLFLGALQVLPVILFILVGAFIVIYKDNNLHIASYYIHCLFIPFSTGIKASLGIAPPDWCVPVVVGLSVVSIAQYGNIFRPINLEIAQTSKNSKLLKNYTPPVIVSDGKVSSISVRDH